MKPKSPKRSHFLWTSRSIESLLWVIRTSSCEKSLETSKWRWKTAWRMRRNSKLLLSVALGIPVISCHSSSPISCKQHHLLGKGSFPGAWSGERMAKTRSRSETKALVNLVIISAAIYKNKASSRAPSVHPKLSKSSDHALRSSGFIIGSRTISSSPNSVLGRPKCLHWVL